MATSSDVYQVIMQDNEVPSAYGQYLYAGYDLPTGEPAPAPASLPVYTNGTCFLYWYSGAAVPIRGWVIATAADNNVSAVLYASMSLNIGVYEPEGIPTYNPNIPQVKTAAVTKIVDDDIYPYVIWF